MQFENFDGKNVIDAKHAAPGGKYENVLNDRSLQSKVLAEAERQLRAAQENGVGVDWKFDNQAAAENSRRFFDQQPTVGGRLTIEGPRGIVPSSRP